MTIVDYNAGTVKDMGLAQAKVVIAKKSQISDAVPRSYYP
jgi:hypothetical protein